MPNVAPAALSPAEHSKHTRELFHKALARSEALCGDYGHLDGLMLEAKVRGLPWVERLEYAIVRMGG